MPGLGLAGGGAAMRGWTLTPNQTQTHTQTIADLRSHGAGVASQRGLPGRGSGGPKEERAHKRGPLGLPLPRLTCRMMIRRK